MKDSCEIAPIQKSKTDEEILTTQVAYLAISGLGCPNCAIRVKNALLSAYGVVDANIDHLDGLGEVTYNPNLIQHSGLLNIVSKAGNDAKHNYSAKILE